MDEIKALTDPASVLIGFAALAGLAAAFQWMKVRQSIDTSGEVVKGASWRDVASAATFTALALGLGSVGYLLERLTGSV